MIYAKDHFNLQPASPATRDHFVATVADTLLPASEPQAARLVGAWFCHEEWFSEVVHVTGFESLAAYESYREAAGVATKASIASASFFTAGRAPTRANQPSRLV